MEIGDQGVHGLETVAGIDENIRPGGLFGKNTVPVGQRFQCAAGGCPDADDAAALLPGLVEKPGRFRREHTEFAVHMMLRHVLHLDRAESSQAHMQRDIGQTDTHFFDLVQKLLGKMQTRSGRGGRSIHLGINGLIALPVGKLRLDIGRQWHFPQAFQNFKKDTLIVELHQAVARVQDLLHRGSQRAVAEGQFRTGLQFPSRLNQALPHAAALVRQQQDLSRPAGGNPLAQQTGGDHAGVIHHQAVARTQIFRQIVKMSVLQSAVLPVQHQQTGAVAALQRRLGDQFLGQVIVKIACFQVCCSFL